MQAFHLQLCGADSYCLDGLYLVSRRELSFGGIWAAIEPYMSNRFLQAPPTGAKDACERFAQLREVLPQAGDFLVSGTTAEHLQRCEALGLDSRVSRTGLVCRTRGGWSVDAYRITPGFEAQPFDAPEPQHPAWRLNTALVGNRDRWSFVQLHEGWLAELEVEPRRDSDGSASVCVTWHAYHRARPELPEIRHDFVCAADDMTEALRLAMSEDVQAHCERLAQTIQQGL